MAKRKTAIPDRQKFLKKEWAMTFGVIKAYFPAIGLYIVSLDGQLASCHSLTYSGGMGFGIYTRGTYAPGDTVLCAMNYAMGNGWILGALPINYGAYNVNLPIAGSSPVDLGIGPTARGGLAYGPVSGCTNDSPANVGSDAHCTPMDQAPGGSYSMMAETGTCFYADPYSIGMQTDDATGVWVFSDDSFLRSSAINSQQIAGGKVEDAFNDNGELSEITGHSMFSWEMYGYTSEPKAGLGGAIRETDLGAKYSGAHYEPEEEAKPFHRVIEYNGYLGQGYQRVVNAPPTSTYSTYIYGTGHDDQYCLSRVAQGVDGSLSLESTRSIVLAKTSFIPCVQTMEVPENVTGGAGDSSNKSGGQYDFQHNDVEIKANPEPNPGDTCEMLQEIMALADYNAHLFNYKLLYPFIYHKKDFYVSDAEAGSMGGPDYKKWFSELREQQFPSAPEPVALDIHDRLKQVNYYSSESGLAFMPEGGVSLYGGYAEEFRMAAGSSTISAPGDIWIRAGRNINLWAGKDIILRAKNCIDETASEGSVRVKAEHHLEMIGGNSEEEGGVLIESRGKGGFDFTEPGEKTKLGGLIIRASEGTAVIEGKDVYTRAGLDSYSGGAIVLDSGQMSGSINMIGDRVDNYVSTKFSINKGNLSSDNQFTTQSVFYVMPGSSSSSPGALYMSLNIMNQGMIVTTESIYSGGNLSVRNGCMAMKDTESMVSPMGDKGTEMMEKILNSVKEEQERLVEQSDAAYGTVYNTVFYTNKPGNEDVLTATGFSFRTTEEYGTEDFQIYNDRWQNIATTVDPSYEHSWLEEPSVTTPKDIKTYPYPGTDYFYDDKPCLVYQRVNLYNDTYQEYLTRGSIDDGLEEKYKTPTLEEPWITSLNDYRITGGEK